MIQKKIYTDYKKKKNQKIEQRVIECVRPTNNRLLKRDGGSSLTGGRSYCEGREVQRNKIQIFSFRVLLGNIKLKSVIVKVKYFVSFKFKIYLPFSPIYFILFLLYFFTFFICFIFKFKFDFRFNYLFSLFILFNFIFY